jgi:hypothetical protein
MFSQQGDADWFDFWLNGHEDPAHEGRSVHSLALTPQAPKREREEVKGPSQLTALSRKCHAKRGKAQQTANKS